LAPLKNDSGMKISGASFYRLPPQKKQSLYSFAAYQQIPSCLRSVTSTTTPCIRLPLRFGIHFNPNGITMHGRVEIVGRTSMSASSPVNHNKAHPRPGNLQLFLYIHRKSALSLSSPFF
jgi:hypothetical protein